MRELLHAAENRSHRLGTVHSTSLNGKAVRVRPISVFYARSRDWLYLVASLGVRGASRQLTVHLAPRLDT